jgi:Zn-dependent protease with chaperone function
VIPLVLPGVVAALVGAAAGMLQRRLPPAFAVRALTLLAVVVAGAAATSLLMLAVGSVAHLAWLESRLGFCPSLGGHHTVPGVFGLVGAAGLGAMFAAAVRRWRLLAPGGRDGDGVEVVASPEALAYAVPGDPGHVVVTTAMLRSLDAQERRVLLAHEHAHLHRGHHRYVRAVHTAAAALPLLRPLCAQIRYATERWADEDAAVAVGDRSLVARAIAAAALARTATAPAAAYAMADVAVVERVRALLEPDARHVADRAAGSLAAAAAVAVATVQLHHLVLFTLHVCHG